MRGIPALVSALALAGVIGAGAAGWFAGVLLGERASTPDGRVLAIDDPAAGAAWAVEAPRSAGGFTGFGGLPALAGDVVRTGTVEESTAGVVVIAGGGSRTTVRYTQPQRLFRIQRPTTQLARDDVVVVRYVDGAAVGVLRVPPQLEAGVGR